MDDPENTNLIRYISKWKLDNDWKNSAILVSQLYTVYRNKACFQTVFYSWCRNQLGQTIRNELTLHTVLETKHSPWVEYPMSLKMMNVYKHTYKYRYPHIQIQISIHTNTDIHTYKYRYPYIQIQISLYTNTDIHTYKYRYPYIQIQISIHTNTDIHIYKYRYPYIQIQTSLYTNTDIHTYKYRYPYTHMQLYSIHVWSSEIDFIYCRMVNINSKHTSLEAI